MCMYLCNSGGGREGGIFCFRKQEVASNFTMSESACFVLHCTSYQAFLNWITIYSYNQGQSTFGAFFL